MILFLASGFSILVLITFFSPRTSHFLREKNLQDWIIDSSNLFVQGTLIPLIQIYVLYKVMEVVAPNHKGSIDIPLAASFLMNFILVDYLYYWNHRILHKKNLLPIHIVHHTAKRMDVLATSRNTLWSSFFIVYLWINALIIYTLKDPTGYIFAATLTAVLDCWRHSMVFNKKYQKTVSKYLGLITPIDHAWHHSLKLNHNFGANLNLFDRLHGTYLYKDDYPETLGVQTKLNTFQKLFNPFASKN
jgi:sterol desaturase/sphingolipid hydroxylase (fatty acid hydroxylase superfamily)